MRYGLHRITHSLLHLYIRRILFTFGLSLFSFISSAYIPYTLYYYLSIPSMSNHLHVCYPLSICLTSFLLSDPFEEVVPDMTNLSEYTYESLVFSFSLIGAMGSLLSDDYEKEDEANQKLSTATTTTNAATSVTPIVPK